MVAPVFQLVEVSQRHAAALAAMALRNRADTDAVDPPRPEAFFTEAGQRARIQRLLARRAGDDLRFWVIECEGAPVGDIGVTGIERGWFLSAHVGYMVDAAHRCRGIATAALERVVALAFDELGLHRLDAGVLTTNRASQRVLEKAGFRRIGTVERYLYLAGGWRDNYLYERVGPDPLPADPWSASAVAETESPPFRAELRGREVGGDRGDPGARGSLSRRLTPSPTRPVSRARRPRRSRPSVRSSTPGGRQAARAVLRGAPGRVPRR